MDQPKTTDASRLFARVAVSVAVSGLAATVFAFFGPTGGSGSRVDAVLSACVALVAFASCVATARQSRGNVQRAWALLALASVYWAAVHIAFAIAGDVHGSTSGLPLVARISAYGYLPLAALGLAMLGRVPTASAARARSLLDGIIFGVVVAFAAWMTFLRKMVENASGGFAGRINTLLLPTGDIVLCALAIAICVTWRPSRAMSRLKLSLVVAGVGGCIASDTMYNVFSVHVAKPPHGVASLGWIVGFATLALGAAIQRSSTRPRAKARLLPFGEVLPSASAAVVLTTVLAAVSRNDNLDLVSGWLTTCLVVCVLIRQVVTVLEEQRLSKLLGERVADKTAALSRREQQFAALVQHSSDVIVIIRDDGRFEYVSPSVDHVLGHSAEGLIGGSITDIVLPEDRPRVMALLAMAGRTASSTITAEWRLRRADGTLRQVEVLVRNLSSEPSVGGIVLNLRDVSERKELEDQLTHQALHDDLTGLANRALLRLRIEQALARWLFQNEPFCLVVVDLDDFKSINDSFGHVAGDAVLKILAERIGRSTRAGDTVVRLTGDEFAVLLEGVAARDAEAHLVADRIINAVRQPMRVEGRTLALRASVGLACVTEEVSQADDIMRNADLALHSAKSNHRGAYVQFEMSMHDAAVRRIEMEADLRRALENDELVVYYQPTVDIATGRMEGVEALLRWPHASKGFISPVEFIPLAEEAGLIVPIGTWVLKQACAEMAKWQTRYPSETPLVLNVNLSGRQLDQPDITDTVREALEDSGLAPNTLVLEMTETVLMENRRSTQAKMQELVELGVKLAIDDFGTGYSSLSYLRQFPIGVLKIDRSFVSGVSGDDATGEESALVQAIVDLARTLQLRTVAEGIETHEQLDKLRRMGCDVGQGFLLAKPAPPEEVRRLIESTHAKGLPLPSAVAPESVDD